MKEEKGSKEECHNAIHIEKLLKALSSYRGDVMTRAWLFGS